MIFFYEGQRVRLLPRSQYYLGSLYKEYSGVTATVISGHNLTAEKPYFYLDFGPVQFSAYGCDLRPATPDDPFIESDF